MFGLGMGELILIFIIALIFIGPKKLPELAKGIGQGIKEFQKAAKGFSDQLENAGEEEKRAEIEKMANTKVHPEIKSSVDEGFPPAIHDDQDKKDRPS